MSGETDLSVLLKTLKPELNEGIYSFHTTNSLTGSNISLEDVLMFFREKESMTLILSEQTAIKYNMIQEKLFSWITLSVHSSLSAVGLTAAFATALAKVNISCNVVSGYYHDHIFVGYEDTEGAMRELKGFM
jgi:hypothetical protein